MSSFAALGLCHEPLLAAGAPLLASLGPRLDALDLALVAFGYAQRLGFDRGRVVEKATHTLSGAKGMSLLLFFLDGNPRVCRQKPPFQAGPKRGPETKGPKKQDTGATVAKQKNHGKASRRFFLVFPPVVAMLSQRLPARASELPPERLAELAVSCGRLQVAPKELLALWARRGILGPAQIAPEAAGGGGI